MKGTTLTQVIEFTDTTAFPVIADPKFTQTWWNKTVYYNRYETKRISDRSVFGLAGAWIPWVPAKVAASYFVAVAETFGYYHSNGQCGKLVFYALGSAPIPQQYGSGEAGGYCK